MLNLGSNLGKREVLLKKALCLLEKLPLKIEKISHLYESSPLEYKSSNYFLNFSLIIRTSLSPWALLLEIKKIELLLGRKKSTSHTYEDRFIDIDIILYEKNIINESFLKIPHPKAHLRAFVMLPSLEIAKNWIHPLFKLSLKDLYQNYQNFLNLQKINLYGKI